MNNKPGYNEHRGQVTPVKRCKDYNAQMISHRIWQGFEFHYQIFKDLMYCIHKYFQFVFFAAVDLMIS